MSSSDKNVKKRTVPNQTLIDQFKIKKFGNTINEVEKFEKKKENK